MLMQMSVIYVLQIICTLNMSTSKCTISCFGPRLIRESRLKPSFELTPMLESLKTGIGLQLEILAVWEQEEVLFILGLVIGLHER